jgi:hypothetical protein
MNYNKFTKIYIIVRDNIEFDNIIIIRNTMLETLNKTRRNKLFSVLVLFSLSK